MLVNVALHENRRDVGVEPDREEHRRQLDGLPADHSRGLGDGECVKVDDAVEDVAVVLARHPVDERAEMVAEVNRTGGLDA